MFPLIAALVYADGVYLELPDEGAALDRWLAQHGLTAPLVSAAEVAAGGPWTM